MTRWDIVSQFLLAANRRFRGDPPKEYDDTRTPANAPAADYEEKLKQEIERYRAVENVHDLPEIFHYWSNKYLVPKYQQFGFSSPKEFFTKYILGSYRDSHAGLLYVISIGAGNCEFEIEIAERLLVSGADKFVLECMDLNPHMLDRGKRLAQEKGVASQMQFVNEDVNSWRPLKTYQVIMANQSLHHFLELETLFEKTHSALAPDGYFLTDDIIGRNGHMRWPEALAFVHEFWKELPERYTYNQQLKRFEPEHDNWDCSIEGFEGIRAQDILPLLIQKFQFDLFVGYGNVIDVFIDRSFGHNFNPEIDWDREFIDRVHCTDETKIEQGTIKPTHMTAAMTKQQTSRTKIHKHLTPEFCVRWP